MDTRPRFPALGGANSIVDRLKGMGIGEGNNGMILNSAGEGKSHVVDIRYYSIQSWQRHAEETETSGCGSSTGSTPADHNCKEAIPPSVPSQAHSWSLSSVHQELFVRRDQRVLGRTAGGHRCVEASIFLAVTSVVISTALCKL